MNNRTPFETTPEAAEVDLESAKERATFEAFARREAERAARFEQRHGHAYYTHAALDVVVDNAHAPPPLGYVGGASRQAVIDLNGVPEAALEETLRRKLRELEDAADVHPDRVRELFAETLQTYGARPTNVAELGIGVAEDVNPVGTEGGPQADNVAEALSLVRRPWNGKAEAVAFVEAFYRSVTTVATARAAVQAQLAPPASIPLQDFVSYCADAPRWMAQLSPEARLGAQRVLVAVEELYPTTPIDVVWSDPDEPVQTLVVEPVTGLVDRVLPEAVLPAPGKGGPDSP